MFPLRAGRAGRGDDVYGGLGAALRGAGLALRDGDVVVVSSKYVSCAQGRTVALAGVRVSGAGRALASRYGLDPAMAELVSRESDAVLGGTPGFVLAESCGMLAPNAGIDGSNAGPGTAVLYPEDPGAAAEQLRRKALLGAGARIGVVISDSRLMPGRVGTTGVAVACAGIEPVRDARASPDLDGRPLRVTFRAVADGVATAANHVMGEGAESVPFALVRGSGARLTGGGARGSEASVHRDQCLSVRGLRAPPLL